MLKKIVRFSIIALVQLIIIGLFAYLLAPALLDSASLQASLGQLLNSSRIYTSVIRISLYICWFFLWPKIVSLIAKRENTVSTEQIQSANKARWILIGCLLVLEIIYWLKSA